MKHSAPNAGFIMVETVMAVALSAALIAGILQILVLVANQRRQTMQYAAATQAAGNVLEHVIARPWEETARDRLASVALSQRATACLPDAKLDVDVVDEADNVRRVRVRIDWSNLPGQRSEPVCLVGWKYRLEEID